MAHPNEELVRKGYEAFLSGDMATLNDLFADDITWHAPGRNQLAGDFRGKEEVFATFAKVFELTGGTFKLEIHDVLANDTHAVVLLELPASVMAGSSTTRACRFSTSPTARSRNSGCIRATRTRAMSSGARVSGSTVGRLGRSSSSEPPMRSRCRLLAASAPTG